MIVAAGARNAERELIGRIEAALAPGKIPESPIRVVVPSEALRRHLLCRLAERRGAWLGLEVATLRATARSVLRSCGDEWRSGEAVLELLVERCAQREPALARALGGLAEAYAGASAAVRDLLDAGFREEHLEALNELLDQERSSVGAAAVGRAQALLRAAAATRRRLAELGLAPESDLPARAAEWIARDPARALPTSALFIHGFADATGVVTDLLESMVRHLDATVVLERPAALDGATAGSWRFGRRLEERLSAAGGGTQEGDPPPDPAQLSSFESSDPAREAAAAVALAAGTAASRAESVAIVARELAPDRSALAREIARQGLPASGTVGSPAPVSRRARALVELLERRDETPVGTLLALGAGRLFELAGARPWELRLAWTARGASRLGEIAELRFGGERELRLPIHDSMRGDPERRAPRASRRKLAATAVAAACAEVADWRDRLGELSRPGPLAASIARLRELLARLGLDEEERQALDEPLLALGEPPLGELEVDARELSSLLRGAWREIGAQPLGGAGSGVQILTVTEARGMVFDHVVALGLVRDRFPRAIRGEPFLPDPIRARLRDLLPDLPVKAEGHDEERFLFAQLLGAASRLDLLHASADGDGRRLSRSPFLDELERAGRLAPSAPSPRSATPSAVDLAREAALLRGREGLGETLEAALRDARDLLRTAPRPAAADARLRDHRLAVLAELGAEPSGPGRDRLGPFFGFAGERREDGPLPATPPVTTLEELSGCGWRAFLGRVLRLEPLPDDGEGIPELPRRLAGSAFHRVLERLAPAGLGRPVRRIEEIASATPEAVAWPAEAEVERLAREAIREVLLEEGFDPELFAPPLETILSRLLDTVHQIDWPEGSRDLLGIEIEGVATIPWRGRERELPFRADRAEIEDGALLLTDYKTGRPVSEAARATTRSRHLLTELARGKRLQLVAYALARTSLVTRGRLLFVSPDLDDDAREVRIDAAALDPELVRATFQALYDAWDRGSFLPRLLDPDRRTVWSECGWCPVRVACLQGDSGERGRLARWLEAHPGRAATDAAADAAFGLWRLAEAQPRNEGQR